VFPSAAAAVTGSWMLCIPGAAATGTGAGAGTAPISVGGDKEVSAAPDEGEPAAPASVTAARATDPCAACGVLSAPSAGGFNWCLAPLSAAPAVGAVALDLDLFMPPTDTADACGDGTPGVMGSSADAWAEGGTVLPAPTLVLDSEYTEVRDMSSKLG
jgi:hypothetical protein